ncbi:type II toxin-antitoxin system CcdA family antitoxin [Paraburkholderia sp. HP33-1]|uniref:type II toxin-antitoxin system CcdA family antitoxin n=1 Tax=Paraburkholderia sp. HP33-1 TaxID=2883243 RepID=UPI001F2F9F59|nr:type II toxin-antitoxin system CcdA family antitoxin [Paraburkholderia sp. HP33-1]
MALKVAAPMKATEVFLSEALLSEARDLGVDITQAAETGLVKAVSDKRAELWLKENEEAIASSNAYVEQHGLPLDEFRMF